MENDSALKICRSLTNEQLRELAKEIHKIGNADKPALVKRSEVMAQMFKVETTPFNYWLDAYHNVSMAITFEIMYRIREDKF
jgi:hypothetical protein